MHLPLAEKRQAKYDRMYNVMETANLAQNSEIV